MPGQIQHHTVPRMYLEGFADGPRMTAINVRTSKVHGISIKDATTQRYFYSSPSAEDPNGFEDALSTVEDRAKPLLTKIDNGLWPLAPEERAVFAAYLALQFMRGPDHRRQLHQAMNTVVRQLAATDPDELARLMSLRGAPDGLGFLTEGLDESQALDGHLSEMSTGLAEIAYLFVIRRWRLVRFDEPALITSDAPVTPMPDPMSEDDGPLGLENAYALLFPLNRRLGLQMFRPRPEHFRPGVLEEVIGGARDTSISGHPHHQGEFNLRTVMNASERVFHHPDDAALVPEQFAALAQLGGRTNPTG